MLRQLAAALPCHAQVNLVSNEVLARRAQEAGLARYLRLARYDRRVWSRSDTVAGVAESKVGAQLCSDKHAGGAGGALR